MQWIMANANGEMVALLSATTAEELPPLPEGFSYQPYVENSRIPVAAGDTDALARVKAKRNALIAAAHWTIGPASPLTPKNQAEWTAYVRQLHKVTKNLTDPSQAIWPPKPSIELAD